MRNINTLMLILTTLILLGCSKKEEVVHNGLPLDGWVARLQSEDPSIRSDALDNISFLGTRARPAERTIRLIARDDAEVDVRLRAVVALDSMGVDTREFDSLKEQYLGQTAEEEEPAPDAVDLGIVSEDDWENEEFALPEDDIDYLKSLVSDTSEEKEEEIPSVMPSDSEGAKDWIEQQQREQMEELIMQMNDPRVLSKLIIMGNEQQRRYAARLLSQMEGEDPEIVEALEKATADEDSAVAMLAKEGLKKWILP